MEKFDQRYLEMAEIWARNSYCLERFFYQIAAH